MPNLLVYEQSPYLLQHAHNPVAWQPWGDAAFARAAAENKPVIISIGYAACHWCHMMERESFEDAATAAYMNEHFICIKVDREERPDVDHLYMDAVQAISGSGGWPLNVFATPERIPFYGGTYFPPQPAFNRISWMQLLHRMQEIWTKQHEEVTAQSAQMHEYLKQTTRISSEKGAIDKTTCNTIAATLLKLADVENGGFGQAPKFPGSMAVSFLLEQHHFTGNTAAQAHALHSLDAMLNGGIYDQLGGGFARYSTDAHWLAPHFEKMLYDNALLILPLCDAFQITGKEHYKKAIEAIIAFVEKELKHPDGGYYSALDADSEGVEGKFYTWTWKDWHTDLGEDAAIAAHYFGITEEGNWEETNILHRPAAASATAAAFGVTEQELETKIALVKEKLLRMRKERIRPQTDDKCLLSWNALMNISLTRAAVALQQPELLEQAAIHAGWLLYNMADGKTLLHSWKDGKAKIDGHLDDYAFLIQALLQLGAASGSNHWIEKAADWTEVVLQQFSNEDEELFYFSGVQQQDIPVRKTDVYDGATPSGNAVMAHNLLLLGLCMEQREWLTRAQRMLQRLAPTAARYAYSFSYWAILLQRVAAGIKTVAAPAAFHTALSAVLAPQCFCINSGGGAIPLLANREDITPTLIFVCTTQACYPPVADAATAAQLMKASEL